MYAVEEALFADFYPTETIICQTFFCVPGEQANQCWHLNYTSQWIKHFPFQSVTLVVLLSILPCQNLFLNRSVYVWHGVKWWMRAVAVHHMHTHLPPSQDHHIRPVKAYLVILWPLSLFGKWTDWLLLKILAQADQIRQHYAALWFYEAGLYWEGVTSPPSTCYDWCDTPKVSVCQLW